MCLHKTKINLRILQFLCRSSGHAILQGDAMLFARMTISHSGLNLQLLKSVIGYWRCGQREAVGYRFPYFYYY